MALLDDAGQAMRVRRLRTEETHRTRIEQFFRFRGTLGSGFRV